jgi:hypothetical protein
LFGVLLGIAYVLMDTLVMMRITLRFLELQVAALAAFRIIRIPFFSKILLRRDSEDKFLVTFTA